MSNVRHNEAGMYTMNGAEYYADGAGYAFAVDSHGNVVAEGWGFDEFVAKYLSQEELN